MEIKLHNTRTN